MVAHRTPAGGSLTSERDDPAVARGRADAAGLFGPDSEAWRLDREAMLLLGAGPRALLLQIAHPAVAAGVAEHSDFRADPWRRLDGTLRSYLRIIYGPEYTEPVNLERLRDRGLGRKRSLALREFALGVEAVERFVRGEPLRRVHECVFGVLALESEAVDPRL